MRYSEAEQARMMSGARTIARKWIHLKARERVLIVTTENHLKEAQLMKQCFQERSRYVDILAVEDRGKRIGVLFDENEDMFDAYHTIVGATEYSIVTTKAAKRAIEHGSKFLSLPLSTNNERSMLAYSFLKMDTKKSKLMAQVIKKYLDSATVLDVTTKAGTKLRMYKSGRNAGFFNGDVKDGGGFSSASIELYIPIEETKTEGTMIVDGSMGYIGKVTEPFRITFSKGRISEIEDKADGKRLKDYLVSFQDFEMYVAGEFGIGLNSYSKCRGECYIEDESAYGTFHIGFGRNIALGGVHEATSHFDLVALEPDIYADNRKIMEKGKIIIPEPQVY